MRIRVYFISTLKTTITTIRAMYIPTTDIALHDNYYFYYYRSGRSGVS
jgi:hypothetical protein